MPPLSYGAVVHPIRYTATMTADAIFAKWDSWLSTIHREGFLVNRHIFREVQAIIQANPKIQLASSFYEWMGNTYATTQVIGVRRQLDKDPDSISFARLLGEIIANPEVLSRDRYVALYTTNPREMAERDFDRLVGAGRTSIDPAAPAKELATLETTADRIRKYANKRIAHFDRSDFKNVPAYAELDDSLDYLEHLLKQYLLLLRAKAYTTIVPVWQYDWKQVFRSAWIE